MNVAPCTVESSGANGSVKNEDGVSIKVPCNIPQSAVGKKCTLGVRPEDLTLASGGDAIFRGKLLLVENLGEVALLYVDCGNPQDPIIAKVNGTLNMDRGSTVGLTAPTNLLHCFDENGRAFERTD